MPPAYVETLFDAYAPGFDAALAGRLGYRGPDLILGALPPGRRYRNALDLGCGTGLAGMALRPLCDRLEGWDISAGMLREAQAKGVYDSLARTDLATLQAPPAPAWDLIVAADVFIYLGALERIASFVARALVPGGSFAFTVEACDEGFALSEARRYRHSAPHLADLLGSAGFVGLTFADAILRHDRGRPVPALVVTATAPEARRESEGEAMAEVA